MQGYGEDLAYIHDRGFELIARNAAPVVLRELGTPRGPVVELGCGGGLIAQELLARGYDYRGYDASEPMVALARERVPEGRFELASFLDLVPPACQGVLAIGEVLGYALDARNTHAEVERTLGRLARCLLPEGALVFDLAGPGRGGAEGTTRNFALGPDWAVTVAASEGADGHLRREITTFREVGGAYRRSAEAHELVLVEPHAVRGALEAEGLEVELLSGYGSERLPGHAVFIARRG